MRSPWCLLGASALPRPPELLHKQTNNSSSQRRHHYFGYYESPHDYNSISSDSKDKIKYNTANKNCLCNNCNICNYPNKSNELSDHPRDSSAKPTAMSGTVRMTRVTTTMCCSVIFLCVAILSSLPLGISSAAAVTTSSNTDSPVSEFLPGGSRRSPDSGGFSCHLETGNVSARVSAAAQILEAEVATSPPGIRYTAALTVRRVLRRYRGPGRLKKTDVITLTLQRQPREPCVAVAALQVGRRYFVFLNAPARHGVAPKLVAPPLASTRRNRRLVRQKVCNKCGE